MQTQTALFPTSIGMTEEKADQEYRNLTAKGAKVHLVYMIEYSMYTTVFYSKQMIEGRLKSIYQFIK
jgi:hypothetical protein